MDPPFILLFDFDGVILTQRALEHAARKHLKNEFYGWRNVEALRYIDLARLFEQSDFDSKRKALKSVFRKYKPLIPIWWKRILFFMRYNRDYQRLEKIYDGFKPALLDILVKLKNKGIPMGIVSNTPKKRLKYFSEKLGLNRFFSVIVCRDDVLFKKPHPYPVYLALKRIKDIFNYKYIDKSRVYFIGDLPSDIQCGNAAKINSMALLSGHGAIKDLTRTNPKLILNDYKELYNIEPFKKLLLD